MRNLTYSIGLLSGRIVKAAWNNKLFTSITLVAIFNFNAIKFLIDCIEKLR